jgi:hypothetical protein
MIEDPTGAFLRAGGSQWQAAGKQHTDPNGTAQQ